ncbi:hypothetical protein [Halobaculum marinum]|uniref:Uncharacterized protein n=1 Tax=Halobaculum marinum TaxID=3031996 RepID=A0ABD5X004_9EURY|nr:hypothetical protein [Halobaculum sp. DT55]
MHRDGIDRDDLDHSVTPSEWTSHADTRDVTGAAVATCGLADSTGATTGGDRASGAGVRQ